jgi:hypothetical protein
VGGFSVETSDQPITENREGGRIMRNNLSRVLLLLFLVLSVLSCEATARDASVIDYQKYLSGLDRKDPESVSKAMDYFKSHFDSTRPEAVRDDAFQAFRAFYYGVIEAYGDAFGKDERIQKVLSQQGASAIKEMKELKSRLSRNGMAVLTTEGMYCIGEDSEFLARSFVNCVSAAFDEFLKIRQKELKEGFSEDAGLRISWESLADRIAVWDAYLSKFPGGVMKKQGDYYRKLYIAAFFTGMDNSRVFDTKGVLTPEVKKAYSYFLRKYPSSESSPLVKKYTQILEKNKNKSSKEGEKFLKENKINTMLGIQPPTQ